MNIPQYSGCMVAALMSMRCPRITFTSDNTNLYTYDLETNGKLKFVGANVVMLHVAGWPTGCEFVINFVHFWHKILCSFQQVIDDGIGDIK